jgi:hypothetical protein
MSQPSVSSPIENEQRGEGTALTSHPRRLVLSRSERWLLAGFGLGLVILLGTAKVMTANQSGLGTHQQLGLPPCSVRVLYGIRCPSCGMTTSWAHLLDGNLVASLGVNPAGTLLCFLAILAAPMTLWMAWSGQGTQSGWFIRFNMVTLILALAISLIDWIVRLSLGL